MTFWHVEPIVEEIQNIEFTEFYFERMDEISQDYVGLSVGDIEVLSVTRLSLFLHGEDGLDLGKCLVTYVILEKLLAFERNIFCAAMYRRKCQDFFTMMQEVAGLKGISLRSYIAS